MPINHIISVDSVVCSKAPGHQSLTDQVRYFKSLEVISQVKGQNFHWTMHSLYNSDLLSLLHKEVLELAPICG